MVDNRFHSLCAPVFPCVRPFGHISQKWPFVKNVFQIKEFSQIEKLEEKHKYMLWSHGMTVVR